MLATLPRSHPVQTRRFRDDKFRRANRISPGRIACSAIRYGVTPSDAPGGSGCIAQVRRRSGPCARCANLAKPAKMFEDDASR